MVNSMYDNIIWLQFYLIVYLKCMEKVMKILCIMKIFLDIYYFKWIGDKSLKDNFNFFRRFKLSLI